MTYAWMLFAYPRDYRREHGAELLEPMLAEARRPTVREGANLFAHGLRTRLGRPASRAVVACAVLATVMAGLFGAAFGSWVGWQTAGPLPPPAWTRALLADVLPGHDFGPIQPPPSAKFGFADQELRWSDADDLLFEQLLFGEGGDYRATTAAALAELPAGTDLDELARNASARLAATGWTVHTPAGAGLHADRDGLALTLTVASGPDGDAAVSMVFERTTPVAAWIGGVAGGLPVAAVAFLVFAWASRRTGRPDHPARLAVAFPFGVVMALWWGPALASVGGRPGVGSALWERLGQPTYSLLFLAGLAFAGLSLFLAALPHHRALRRALSAGR